MSFYDTKPRRSVDGEKLGEERGSLFCAYLLVWGGRMRSKGFLATRIQNLDGFFGGLFESQKRGRNSKAVLYV